VCCETAVGSVMGHASVVTLLCGFDSRITPCEAPLNGFHSIGDVFEWCPSVFCSVELAWHGLGN